MTSALALSSGTVAAIAVIVATALVLNVALRRSHALVQSRIVDLTAYMSETIAGALFQTGIARHVYLHRAPASWRGRAAARP